MIWQVNAALLLISLLETSTAKEISKTDYIQHPYPTKEIVSQRLNDYNIPIDASLSYSHERIDTPNEIEELKPTSGYRNTSREDSDDDDLIATSSEDVYQRSSLDFPEFPQLPSVNSEPRANMEGSEIPEASFVVPEEHEGPLPPIPAAGAPTRTYALTIQNGKNIHNDIRKDNGEYVFSYTSADGSKRTEVGSFVTLSDGRRTLVKRGSYSYRIRGGETFQVDYQGDSRGFRILKKTPLNKPRDKPVVVNRPAVVSQYAKPSGIKKPVPTQPGYTPTVFIPEGVRPRPPYVMYRPRPSKHRPTITRPVAPGGRPLGKPSPQKLPTGSHDAPLVYPFYYGLPVKHKINLYYLY